MPGRLTCQRIIDHIASVRNGNKVTVNVCMPLSFRADTSAKKALLQDKSALCFAGPCERGENLQSHNFKRVVVSKRRHLNRVLFPIHR